MSRILCTFSGQYGDALWSLATVKAIADVAGTKVDFAIMPEYKSVLSLIQAQSYIEKAFAIDGWILMHRNYGAQPWNPPGHEKCIAESATGCGALKCYAGYDQCWHLGYRSHPGRSFGKSDDAQLLDFIAQQMGIRFPTNPLPFLSVPNSATEGATPIVAYAFNEQYGTPKRGFIECLKLTLGSECRFADVGALPWVSTADAVNEAVCFVGCRSANYVIAHGLAKKCFIFEPHPARNFQGHLGKVFGCSYGQEVDAPLNMPPAVAADYAASTIRSWVAARPEVAQ